MSRAIKNTSSAASVPSRPAAWFKSYWATVLVFVLLLCATMGISLQEYGAARIQATRQLQIKMHDAGQGVIENFLEYEKALTTARGFVAASNHVSYDEWGTFFESSSLHEQYPGVSGFAYVQKIANESSSVFVDEMLNDIPWYNIRPKPDADHPNLYLIKYFYPEHSNKDIFGINVASRAASKDAFEYAAHNNTLAISKPLRLHRSKGNQWGMVVIMPLYAQDPADLTPEQRLEQCTGWVACPLELDTFFAAESHEDTAGFHITLRTKNKSKSTTIIYDSGTDHASSTNENTQATLGFNFGGQPFELDIHYCGTNLTKPLYARAHMVSLVAALFALILTAVVYVSSRTGIQARRIALEMTRSLRSKEFQHQALVEQANAANESKSEFLANMSHEIRTPLTAVLGYTEVLGDQISETTPPEDLHHSLECIQRSGEHLRAIINDVLDLSKIDAGKIDLHPIACHFPDLIREVVESFRVRALDKGLALAVLVDSPVPESILADDLRIRQVLINLIGNAIKFTDTGSITICIDYENQTLTIQVRDTGIGVTPQAMHNLFRPFEQVDNSTTRQFEGTGLGLTISRKIARLMLGDVTAESTPGLGSTFTFRFPVETTDSPVLIDTISGFQPTQRIPSATTNITGRVLIAEDGLDNQRLISHFLRRAGLRVEFAANGKIAQEILVHDQSFDVIVMDMQMPVQDGYETARNLRKQGCTIPIIALTAHAMDGDREKCINAG
ncbi:MAG: CHASE domain-containing protein, partial [Phycisphaerales bacterium]|nr:CHASE domain-containing protein [Phycisphaerales bacterium]